MSIMCQHGHILELGELFYFALHVHQLNEKEQQDLILDACRKKEIQEPLINKAFGTLATVPQQNLKDFYNSSLWPC